MYFWLRLLVLALVLLPMVAALVLPFFGRFARRAAVYAAVAHLVATAVVVFGAVIVLDERGRTARTGPNPNPQEFRPEFVPGDPAQSDVSDAATHRTRWTLLSLSDTPAFDPNARTPLHRPGPHVQFFLGRHRSGFGVDRLNRAAFGHDNQHPIRAADKVSVRLGDPHRPICDTGLFAQ